MKKQLFFYCLFIFIVSLFVSCSNSKTKTATYEFTSVRRGTIERTVSSSGTINPVATVKVLPRMSGKVEAVYVDYNQNVKKGDVLARLNTDMLRLQRDQQQATVQKARANYELQMLSYRNQEALAQRDLISEYELKTSKTSLDNQMADLAVAEANLRKIDTEINQYAFITSPIDGIVLDRNINLGDTVVDSTNSNSNSSSIFTIAENLRDMQIEAMIGELDVTSIRKGQQVRFTLESLPGRRFSGVVETLRMVPVISSSVVSYTVIINVENLDGSLLPGMTCAVDFIVERSVNVLSVSNAALRYQPTSLSAIQISDMTFNASLEYMNEEQKQAAIEARAQQQSNQQKSNSNQGIGTLMTPQTNMRGMSVGTRQSSNRQNAQGTQQAVVWRTLWFINAEGKLSCMQVRAGISDGSSTEIFIPQEAVNPVELEGMQVIHRERL